MQDVTLVILAKPVVTLKLQLINMWKKTKNILYIYIHSHDNEECFSSFNSDYLAILDYSQTQFQVIIKESMYIYWEKANLNKQLNHFVATLSI